MIRVGVCVTKQATRGVISNTEEPEFTKLCWISQQTPHSRSDSMKALYVLFDVVEVFTVALAPVLAEAGAKADTTLT